MNSVEVWEDFAMTEYPAMIYKSNRNNVFVANCLVKNLVGFGKTETDALNNLKESLEGLGGKCEITLKPMYGLQINQQIG